MRFTTGADLESSERVALYRAHCDATPSVPIFSQAWWLDIVSPSAWDVALCMRNDEIVGSLPFAVKSRMRMTVSGLPPLTPRLGPWTVAPAGRHAESERMAILGSLSESLPAFDYFAQNWSTSQPNWLPFYWAGFTQTTRYTYVLEDLSNLDAVWSSAKSSVRNDIRKAKGRYSLSVQRDATLGDFIQLNDLVFKRQGLPNPYSRHVLDRVDAACAARDARSIIVARSPDGAAHAACYLVHDALATYYLMGGSDPELRGSGATTLCLWTAIEVAAHRGGAFDFEGSMMPQVEPLFRAFGSRQVAYHHVTAPSSSRYQLARAASELRDHLRGRR